MPVDREIRKDRPFPRTSAACEDMRRLWQVYGDDLDFAEIGDMLNDLDKLMNEEDELQRRAFTSYDEAGALRAEDKTGTRVWTAERLGLYFDGANARLCISARRLSVLIGITFHILSLPAAPVRWMLILMGHWGHAHNLR